MKVPTLLLGCLRISKFSFYVFLFHIMFTNVLAVLVGCSFVANAINECVQTDLSNDVFKECFSDHTAPIFVKLLGMYLILFVGALPSILWYKGMFSSVGKVFGDQRARTIMPRVERFRITAGSIRLYISENATKFWASLYVMCQIVRLISCDILLFIVIPRFNFVSVELPGYSGQYECPISLYGDVYTCPMNCFTGLAVMSAAIIMLHLLRYANLVAFLGDLLWFTFSKTLLFNRVFGLPVGRRHVVWLKNLGKDKWLVLSHLCLLFDEEEFRKVFEIIIPRSSVVYINDGVHLPPENTVSASHQV